MKKDDDDDAGALISAEGGTVSHVFRHPVACNVISSLRMIGFLTVRAVVMTRVSARQVASANVCICKGQPYITVRNLAVQL